MKNYRILPGEKVVLPIYLTLEMRQQIEKRAEEMQMSMSYVVRTAIESYLGKKKAADNSG